MKKIKILIVIGTRPEAIKLAPLIVHLRKESWAEVRVLATAQHRELLDQVLTIFSINPDIDLNIMEHDQSLSLLTSKLLDKFDSILSSENPDIVLAQGDTTSAMVAALSCFYKKIPFGHLEAGLRTYDIHNPFPEEFNRQLIGKISKWHFAPTELAMNNLVNENISKQDILVTGNTGIDALLMASAMLEGRELKKEHGKRLLLVTAHRRENFGTPIQNICEALKIIASQHKDIKILFPVHPNPNIRQKVHQILNGCENIILSPPLGYREFIEALNKAYFVITDSGGIQEEAPSIGKPVLILRNETERPEALEFSISKLVGTEKNKIIHCVNKLLLDDNYYKKIARPVNCYGDGRASERIINFISNKFLLTDHKICHYTKN
jgi:UDP-N-acetylglucosamine 2-epimerase (non-hydrolysing)